MLFILSIGKVYICTVQSFPVYTRRPSSIYIGKNKIKILEREKDMFLVLKYFQRIGNFYAAYEILTDDIIGYIIGLDLRDVKEI